METKLLLLMHKIDQDELIWGAAWLYKASNKPNYRDFVKANIQSMGNLDEFGWDCKHAGINVLVSHVTNLSTTLYFLHFDLKQSLILVYLKIGNLIVFSYLI